MPGGWTVDRVLQLAPDPASAKAGQGLASARKWVSIGRDSDVVWGECQGSGAKPYQVRIELSEPAYKCSCPSRKFPCKHSIGLMLLLAADEIKSVARPAWVEEWLASRAQRVKKKQEETAEPAKPIDAEAQAKRRAKRLDRVGDGITSIKTWAEDLIRSGIAGVPSQAYAFFDEPARRMVDAQAPGVARMIRDLSAIAMSGAGWQERFVQQLASLHLLTSAFERLDQLSSDVAEDILATAGISRSQEEVLLQPGVTDNWQILAQEIELEDRLRVQRTWLFGTATSRPAMVLHFAHGAGPLDATLQPSMAFDGELCFFGGNQIRAAVKSRNGMKPLSRFGGLPSLDIACAAFGQLLARNPWLDEVGVAVQSVIPVRIGQQWRVIDQQHGAMPLTCSDESAWLLMALSGAEPIDLAVAITGSTLRPLAAIAGGEYVSLVVNNRGD